MKILKSLPLLLLLVGALVLSTSSTSSTAAEEAFSNLSYEKAMEKAAKENKLVFLDFYTTWCGPCKMLDRDTLSDEKVIAWLKKHTIALKIDAEKNTKLARQFEVAAYPTLIFVKPVEGKADGKIVGRVGGYLPPQPFLEEAEGALTGKDPLTRAREKYEAAGENNPIARLEYADTLFRKEKFADALDHYLWLLDHGLEHDPDFQRVRLTHVMSSLAQLMQYHPPVRKEIEQRRDAAVKALRNDPKQSELAAEIHAYNQVLNQPERTRDLYASLKKEHPDSPAVSRLLLAMLPEKLRQREYDWLYKEMNVSAQLEHLVGEYKEEVKAIEADKDLKDTERKELLETLKRYYAFRMTDLYQLALGAGEPEAAAKLSDRILAFYDSPEVLNVLAWSGYLTDQPVKANLDQAKRAYDMTDGKDASIVDTYVRLLYEFDQKDKAADILDKALSTVEEGQGKDMLLYCRQSLGLRTSG